MVTARPENYVSLIACLALALASTGSWAGDLDLARLESADARHAASPSRLPAPSPSLPENFRKVSNRIFSGASPESAEEFAALRSEQITVVVSVDGAAPEVEMARKAGLWYYHLPIAYSGVSMPVASTIQEILFSSDAAIFIHCHHGKHRGPAVAAIAAMLDGEMDRAGAAKFLQVSGTGREYQGLWRDVGEFAGVPEDTESLPLVASAPVADLVTAMAEADRTFDRLKALLKPEAGSDDGTVTAVQHDATLLMESFREMGRLNEVGEFADDLQSSATLAEELQRSLATEIDTAQSVEILQRLKTRCADCHRDHRN